MAKQEAAMAVAGMALPTKHENAPPHHKPHVGAMVHFYDESRAQNYSRQGGGPYAAMVTFIDLGGVCLKVFAPHAVFDVERVLHKSQLETAPQASKRKWWEWPSRA